ncbi:MAG: phosphoribosylglycinamide synthetase C domain-containing protein, partial [Candidatus Micrarchaeota archaeon]
IVKYTHHKKLIEIKNRTLNLCVTLDHKMVGIESNRFRKGERKIEFVAAKNLPNQFVVFRSSNYVGARNEFFVLPGVVKYHRAGRNVVGRKANDVAIKMDDWLKFFGLWLAEGYTVKRGYAVGLCQCKPRVKKEIREILLKLPFKFTEQKNSFVCYDKSLWSYLRPLGEATTKFIPEEYLSLSREQLQLLYAHMFLGDGNQTRQTRIYYTSSKKLAENVQEILMKIGRVGVIKERTRKSGGIGDRKFKEINPSYEVMERIEKTVSWIDKRDTQIIDYDGAVYCVEVPNHILYVKYDEKPLWCGNTSCFWSAQNTLFKETLAKMRDKLAASGYAGYIDINCIANARGIYPLEFTSRFGYPTLSLFAEGVTTPWGEFFYRLGRGETPELKTKKGFQVCVVIAVPPFPFDDQGTFKKYSEDAVILFKKDSLEGVHLGDVKLVEGDWRVAGNVGYALVVTGSGGTMDEARKQVYARVKNVMIPNMFYRTDIGTRWYHDSDKLQMWGYLY